MKNIFQSEATAVLRLTQFRFFLAYRFVMTAATIMQSVIVGWHLYSITHDVLSLGMIGLTEVIPQISVSLFAGHFILDKSCDSIYIFHRLMEANSGTY